MSKSCKWFWFIYWHKVMSVIILIPSKYFSHYWHYCYPFLWRTRIKLSRVSAKLSINDVRLCLKKPGVRKNVRDPQSWCDRICVSNKQLYELLTSSPEFFNYLELVPIIWPINCSRRLVEFWKLTTKHRSFFLGPTVSIFLMSYWMV